MAISKYSAVLAVFLLATCVDGYSYTGTVNAPTPTIVYGGTARVHTASTLLLTDGGQTTVLNINGVNGYNIIAVFCNVMATYENSSPIYGQVSVAGQSINTSGGTAQCVWVNNGGGSALGYVSADVVFVQSSL